MPPPPFGLAEIPATVPKHCWAKDTWRSMGYVARDVAAVVGLAAAVTYLSNWDCGHRSFSNNHKLNSVVEHLLHFILVPYHGWLHSLF